MREQRRRGGTGNANTIRVTGTLELTGFPCHPALAPVTAPASNRILLPMAQQYGGVVPGMHVAVRGCDGGHCAVSRRMRRAELSLRIACFVCPC